MTLSFFFEKKTETWSDNKILQDLKWRGLWRNEEISFYTKIIIY